ncbi:MAG: NAD(P)/FAD-dependent oxidoreductase [Thermotogae bacterium]|nr:NAD(P)/FAD-dependent oxidoreductase [Thermotogota bacterium]
MYDVIIIGAGVVGCALARELSKYEIKTAVLEKYDDVSLGASKANSGIIHGDYSAKNGTMKAKMLVKGNKMFDKLDRELNFGYRKTGALVVGFNEEDRKKIEELHENALKNGSYNTEIFAGEKIFIKEPNLSKNVKYALYDSNVGVASPYEFTVALAENSIKNGVEYFFENEVKKIEKNKYFKVYTDKGVFESLVVVNAAGIFSDSVSAMAGEDYFKINPRKGSYLIFDRAYSENSVDNVIFQTPSSMGKGILVTKTYWGNLLIGPDAQNTDLKDDYGTDFDSVYKIIKTAKLSYDNFDFRKILTTFSGLRAAADKGDFIIEKTGNEGFINAAGIESPGLTSSPAIAEHIRDIIDSNFIKLNPKKTFLSYRPPIIIRKVLSDSETEKLINSDSPKQIICRCERVSKEEILDALSRGMKADSVDAVKRRTRATMGSCQGGFCRERVRKILEDYYGYDVPDRRDNPQIKKERLKRLDLIKELLKEKFN